MGCPLFVFQKGLLGIKPAEISLSFRPKMRKTKKFFATV